MRRLLFFGAVICFLSSFALLKASDVSTKFKRPAIAENLKCDLFFANSSSSYTEHFRDNPLTFKDPEDPDDLPMDCDSIKARHYFSDKPGSKEEAEFPIAEVRLVFKDYYWIEMELASTYEPQNEYCYAMDKKSDKLFHSRIKALAKCFPNVHVTQKEYEMDSTGRGINRAAVECLKVLVKRDWKYVQLLENYDVSLRPNREKVQIFKWLNGTNDVEQDPDLNDHFPRNPGWSFSELKLFKNKTRNTMEFNSHEPKFVTSKGYYESSFSREFIDFVMRELDLTILLDKIDEANPFAFDELLFPTLNLLDGAPGGSTRCNKKIDHITRYSMWKWAVKGTCNYWRHGICIHGVQELASLERLPHLYLNKLMPGVDFAATVCWYERLFNMTYIEKPRQLNESFYTSLTNVRLQKLKNKDGIIDQALLKTFDGCKNASWYQFLYSFLIGY